jgi:hypothetical protein
LAQFRRRCHHGSIMLWRIVLEERELSRDADYGAYCAAVRWRLIPRIL